MNEHIRPYNLVTPEGREYKFTLVRFSEDEQYTALAGKILHRQKAASSRDGWIVTLPDGRDRAVYDRGKDKGIATYLTLLDFGIFESMTEGELLELWLSSRRDVTRLAGFIAVMNDQARITEAMARESVKV